MRDLKSNTILVISPSSWSILGTCKRELDLLYHNGVSHIILIFYSMVAKSMNICGMLVYHKYSLTL